MKEDIKKSPKDIAPPAGVGSIVEGKVVARDRSALYIDLGSQGTGIIFGREFYQAKDTIKALTIGDVVHAKVVEMENDDGYRELSLQDATKEIGWQKLKEMKDSGEMIPVKITGVNKGGLLTSVNGMAAFLPVSQLSAENYPRVADADKGKTLEVKILDLVAEENKLILSEKAKAEMAIKKILENYKKGDEVEGTITGIADFGAFIRFPVGAQTDSIEGLIHISELDWQLVQNPAEVVKVGEVIKAKVIDIHNNQVFLSLKALKENPWEEIEKKYKKGDTIEGKVISFSAFGAFVEVLPKIRGLCHISEFASQKEMEDSLKPGQSYKFEILGIEPKEHRMSLKLAK
jgi:small subunit ribosomal protein S1